MLNQLSLPGAPESSEILKIINHSLMDFFFLAVYTKSLELIFLLHSHNTFFISFT